MNHENGDLKIMQSWPLERKISVTQSLIIEWYMRHNGQVAVSFSGGKDSTVLLDLARRCFPDIEAVYVDTGMEFPEVRDFIMTIPNMTVLKPQMNFKQVLDTYGWCFPTKEMAYTIHYARRGSKWALDRLHGVNADGSPNRYRQSHYMKWAFLLDAPFKISDGCCLVMKERPIDNFQKRSGKLAIVGTRAQESERRRQAWLRTGCNAYDSKRPMSKPLSFWMDQDVLHYIRDFNVSYASVYGEIAMDENGQLYTTGETRTGCIFCPIGCNREKVNRFQRLAITRPMLYEYCVYTLGLGELLDYAGVDY